MWEDFFYTPEVLGKDGKPFRIYKIRTMWRDADDSLESVLTEQGLDSCGKICDDPRITSRGKFLRKYWIDELPQVVNLIKRDIRIIGIRPKSERMWQEYPEEHKERALHYKPGWMGVHYAYPGKTFQDIMETEMRYLEQMERSDSPTLVDIEYCLRIVYGFFFQGLRSH